MNTKQKYSIGRAYDNDIVINHETVSRKHAEMTVDDERIVITDFNSKNGTFIIRNNNPVQVKIVEVSANDTVAFGNVIMKVSELLRMSSISSKATPSYETDNIKPPSMPPIPPYQSPSNHYARENLALEYAGFWRRVGASFIDGILLVILFIIIGPLLILIYGPNYFAIKDEKFFAGFADFILTWLFPVIVIILFWVKKQATPGKMALSVKIVDSKTGGIPSVWQFIGRYFAYFLSTLPLCLGFLWVAFDSKKQGWHDKLAGTLVVKYKKKPVRFE